ncbi:MAG: hypothetical protein QF793_01865 [Candidatus Peribacteraceae bacterium]|nr:hypothetical protein [Candidatus Peribacteraceae bacterium]
MFTHGGNRMNTTAAVVLGLAIYFYTGIIKWCGWKDAKKLKEENKKS